MRGWHVALGCVECATQMAWFGRVRVSLAQTYDWSLCRVLFGSHVGGFWLVIVTAVACVYLYLVRCG